MGVQIPNYKDIIDDALANNESFSSQVESETDDSGETSEENDEE